MNNEQDLIENVVIIGSGIAGYTASIYTARANLNPVLFTGQRPGGQLIITTEVENYPGFPQGIKGPELMENIKKQAIKFNTRVVDSIVKEVNLKDEIKIVKYNDKTIKTYSVIIATGATAQWLNIAGEKEYRGRGVSACATCDGFFFRDGVVVVIGGGDTAMEEALFLTKFASKVIVCHRRDKLRASKIMQDRAFSNRKIEFVWNSLPVEMIGDGNKITALKIKNKLSDKEEIIACDGIFVAIGHRPETDIFKDQIELDEKEYIVLKDRTSRTNIEGVFACGDVVDARYRQAITAGGMGCIAAMDAIFYLQEKRIV
ncbi:MAG: thioredoxin-disulfide reductase [Candidatus Hydrogenedentota bacterium]